MEKEVLIKYVLILIIFIVGLILFLIKCRNDANLNRKFSKYTIKKK